MKIITIITFFLIFGVSEIFGQTVLANYAISNERDSLSVRYVLEGDDKYQIFVDLNDRGNHSIELAENDINRLNTFLTDSFEKYLEWDAIAKANQVKEVRRDISEISLGESLAFRVGSWQFHFGNVSMRSSMSILDGNSYLVWVIPKVSSRGNRYIESDTQVLMFENKEQLESLLNLLDLNDVRKRVDEYNRIQSLFGN